jgi:hypothetical protein
MELTRRRVAADFHSMKLSRHLAGSVVLSLALAPWLAWRSLLVLAGGALLDLDRYLWHILRYRTLRLQTAIERFQGRERIRGGPRFFHSVEFLVLLGVAGIFWRSVWVLALGVVSHVLLDLFVHKKRGRFWLYPDWSHLHCLAFEWFRGRYVGAHHAAPDSAASDNPSEDEE